MSELTDADKAILRAAVAAMPHTNPGVADDLIGGFTMHTEAEDIIAIWRAAAQAAQPEAVGDERLLRTMLAIRVAGPTLYADDGELQDNSVQPFIDFKRDSAKEIERKLLERGMANAWKSIGQFASAPTPEPSDAERLFSLADLEAAFMEGFDSPESMHPGIVVNEAGECWEKYRAAIRATKGGKL